MSPKKQRILIAEKCGWIFKPDEFGWSFAKIDSKNAWWKYCSRDSKTIPFPDYLSDLNAMHQAEEHLGDVDNWLKYEGFLDEGGTKFIFHATAAQRAEAFLRVFGLWEE
jgi:hypothetical protein